MQRKIWGLDEPIVMPRNALDGHGRMSFAHELYSWAKDKTKLLMGMWQSG